MSTTISGLIGKGFGETVALITDGRFNGATGSRLRNEAASAVKAKPLSMN